MIEIRDPQLRLLMLAHLIRELQGEAARSSPPPAGLTEVQAAELRGLTSDELVRLAEMPDPKVAISIDAGSFEHGLRQVDYLGKRSRQLEYFIRHGATKLRLVHFHFHDDPRVSIPLEHLPQRWHTDVAVAE